MIEIFQGDDAELLLEFLQPLKDEPLDTTGHSVECLVCDPSGNPVVVDAPIALDASQGQYLQPLKALMAGQYAIQVVVTDRNGKLRHEPIVNITIKKVLPRVKSI